MASLTNAYSKTPKINPVPSNGVNMMVFLTKIVPGQPAKKDPKKTTPVTMYGIPLQTATLQCKIPSEKMMMEKPDITFDKHTETIEAMCGQRRFRMFNCPISKLSVGNVVLFTGLTLTKYEWVEEMGENEAYDGAEKVKEKHTMYTPDVARVQTIKKQTLNSIIENIPFEKRCFIPEQDFCDPESDIPYEITYEGNHAITMHLLPYSKTNVLLEYGSSSSSSSYPPAPPSYLVATLTECVHGDASQFLYVPEKDGEKPSLTLGGPTKEMLQLIVVQTNMDPKRAPLRLCVYTRLYEECIRTFQVSDWLALGPILAPHICGTLIGTLNRQKTKDVVLSFNRDLFQSAVMMFSQLNISFYDTFESACMQGNRYQCGIKTQSRALLEKILMDPKLSPPSNRCINSDSLIGYDGVNLSLFEKPFNVLFPLTMKPNDILQFYIITNGNLKRPEWEALSKEKDDKIIFDKLIDPDNYTGRTMIINVYCAVYNGMILDALKGEEGEVGVTLRNNKRVRGLIESAVSAAEKI